MKESDPSIDTGIVNIEIDNDKNRRSMSPKLEHFKEDLACCNNCNKPKRKKQTSGKKRQIDASPVKKFGNQGRSYSARPRINDHLNKYRSMDIRSYNSKSGYQSPPRDSHRKLSLTKYASSKKKAMSKSPNYELMKKVYKRNTKVPPLPTKDFIHSTNSKQIESNRRKWYQFGPKPNESQSPSRNGLSESMSLRKKDIDLLRRLENKPKMS